MQKGFQSGCGCNTPKYVCPTQCYTQNCNTCSYEDVMHPMNYHTNNIHTVIRRHVMVPTYTQSNEVVYVDQYVETPIQNPTLF